VHPGPSLSGLSSAPLTPAAQSMNDRLRVLLVDSDPNDRALAALVLRRELAELEIEEAGDAMVLADRLPRGGYAAVVTEYRLAWGDGLQVLE
jgi:DNA-binding NtrC family response regulator